MCGIAGALRVKLDIPLLTRDLFHRGPDDQRTFSEGDLVLHHHRLAILDIACGIQPMYYKHYTLIFNGQVYNHLEIRRKYSFDCKTNSDTETILHAYERLGPACLDEFDGMFAFCIYDKNKKELFLARDRAGKKPLYYYSANGQFVFCSELKALYHQVPLTINDSNIREYVRMGYFYKNATAYNNVYEIPAGSYAYVSVETGNVKVTEWWNIHKYYKQRQDDSFDVALKKVDEYLHEAVKNRVESSDLEVGSFLSGGIDSGLITAIATEYSPSIKTFTVSFDGAYDEAPLAKLVAEKYKTDHYEINISYDNLLNDVETIMTNYGEPFFDNSAIPSYYVSKAAKEHLTVILNGDGGDEIFGGYRRYVPFKKFDFFKSRPLTRKFASALHAVLPPSHDKKSKYNYIYRLSDIARKNNLDIYLTSTIDIFEGYEKYLPGDDSFLGPVKKDFDAMNDSGLTGLQKIMNMDFDNILSGILLVKIDIATMAHSLEGRSPLLCKKILEYVPGLPDNYKIRGVQTKYLLRKLAEKYLPAPLINQPKRGFEPPLKQWVNNQLRPLIGDYLIRSDTYYKQFIDKKFIEDLFDNRIKVPAEKRIKMLWLAFTLELWYQRVYKQATKAGPAQKQNILTGNL
jgi:asparagine synthase (glutamine-hydrolysing)